MSENQSAARVNALTRANDEKARVTKILGRAQSIIYGLEDRVRTAEQERVVAEQAQAAAEQRADALRTHSKNWRGRCRACKERFPCAAVMPVDPAGEAPQFRGQ